MFKIKTSISAWLIKNSLVAVISLNLEGKQQNTVRELGNGKFSLRLPKANILLFLGKIGPILESGNPENELQTWLSEFFKFV